MLDLVGIDTDTRLLEKLADHRPLPRLVLVDVAARQWQLALARRDGATHAQQSAVDRQQADRHGNRIDPARAAAGVALARPRLVRCIGVAAVGTVGVLLHFPIPPRGPNRSFKTLGPRAD